MSAGKRAFLYITRKKGKALLLLLCFFIILMLVLTSLEINGAAKVSATALRKTFEGYFKVSANTSGTETVLNDKFIASVMELGGLKSYNAVDSCYLTVPELVLSPGKFTAAGDTKAQMTTFINTTDSGLNQYFMADTLTLAQGEHISPEDTGVALVSRTLADMNGLTTGDTISAIVTEDISSDSSVLGLEFSFRIKGIFDEINTFASSAATPECAITANYIFIDQTSGNEISSLLNGGRPAEYEGGVTFFVDDPEEMNGITDRIMETLDAGQDTLKITKNNSAYEQAMIPLQKLGGMTRLMTFLIAVIGCVIISLLLLLWERDRIREIGLLMSVGIKKSGIFLQQLLECVLVFAAAFLLAAILSLPVSRQVGAMMYSGTAAKAEENAASLASSETYMNGYGQAGLPEEDVSFEAGVSVPVLAGSAGIGLLLTIISVGISFLAAAGKKPRELLTILE